MNPEMMTVLSMRQKEMSYEQLARAAAAAAAVAPMPTHAPSAASYFAPVGGYSSRPSSFVAMAQSPAPQVTSYYGAKETMARGVCYSPLSVGQLPQHAVVTANYDQYGFAWHWISEICAHFALQRQTAHYAVCYAQRLLRQRLRAREEEAYFLRAYDDIFTVQKELQVLGLICVFIAAKIEEVHPPKAADFAELMSERGAVTCSTEDVVRLEGEYCTELKWNLHPTTVLSWLLFLLAGDASDKPAETMGDFVNVARISSVRKDVFAAAISLIDAALLDYQSMEFLPSVLAGSAILLADPGLDLMFVAQFLQLDPTLLWECKNWMYMATNGLSDFGCEGVRDQDRWAKVPVEEMLFIQADVPVPSHLAYGLLRNENTTYDYASMVSNQSDNNAMYGGGGDGGAVGGMATGYVTSYVSQNCTSPSTCDSYGCYCQDGYPCHASTAAPPNAVYHFKYGWQGPDMGYSAPTVQRKLHFS